MSLGSMVSCTVKQIMDEGDHQEQDEIAVFELEQQMANVQEELKKAKFKYEKRALYEL